MAREPAVQKRLILAEERRWARWKKLQNRASFWSWSTSPRSSKRPCTTGGRIALLYVSEPSELQHWVAIENLAREERREEAEQLLQRLCEEIAPIAGTMPAVYIREGRRRDELLALIAEEPSISILVLAAGTGPEGPGPLITYLTGQAAARLRIPITIVPGGLTLEQLDAVS